MASRYWVGNGGNWNDNTNHWAASSGGAPGASLPGSSDNVFFDANSFSSGSQIVNLNVGATFNNMTWAGVTNTPTLSGTGALNCYGSLTFVAGMVVGSTGDIIFYSGGLSTFTTAGHTLNPTSGVLFGLISAGNYTVSGNLNVGNTKDIYNNNGTLNLGANTITCRNFYTNGTITRTLNMSSSTVNCVQFIAGGSGLTLNAGTSTINCVASSFSASFNGAGKTYNNVTLTGTTLSITGTNTMASLSVTGAAVKTGYCILYGNQTISGALSIQGNSAVNRVLFSSSVVGTAVVVSAGSIGTLANVDFKDVDANGAATPWTGTSLGDSEGNSDITFTTATTRYWIGGTGTWSDTAHWSTSSGGSGGASVPLPQDDVIFDSNSGMTGSETVTINMARLGENLTFSTSGAFTIELSEALNLEIYGSLTVTQSPNFSAAFTVGLTMAGRSSHTIDVAADFYLPGSFNVDSVGGTVTQNSDVHSGGFDSFSGTFNLNGFTWTVDNGAFSIGSTGRACTYNAGAGMIVLDHSVSGISSFQHGAATFNRGTSTILCKAGTSGEITFGGNGSYYRLKIEGDAFVYSSNTFYILEIDAPTHLIRFGDGDTQTIESDMLGGGDASNNVTIESFSGNPFFLTKTSGIVLIEYVTLSHSHASGGATWRAGNSTDNGDNDGWSFVISKVLTETITITATIRKGGRKIIADTMTLLDTVVRGARKILTDAQPIVDIFAIINFHITLYETIVVNEIFGRTVQYIKALSDTLGITEIFVRLTIQTIVMIDQLRIRELPRLALNGIVTAFWSRVAKDGGGMTKVAKDDGSGYTKVAKDTGGFTAVAKDTPDWTKQNKDY